ncbi:ArsR family transcriptional regulator [Roseomonas marmotae]|uniref:ArsR family transcriptional regulator n=2 Tax=Roseomonas marmotae TaxID=2768161 RepID=A0ABS3KCP4_9PROT|nr:ArsR family transcriptional regulator [Roseomonas marmotae]QTI80782.1 ArsR family transcriptional regulator [Roseomonas marmotae]
MVQMITGHWVTQIIHGAAMAGYAEHLHRGPASAEELARLAGMNPSAVFRHLRACAGLGLVTFDEGRFTATPLLDTLRRDHPQSLRGFAMSQAAPGHWLPWARFGEALRSGIPQTVPALGAEIFEYYRHNPQEADAFTEAMDGFSAATASEVARVLDAKGAGRVVDVGGAGGALLVPFLEANPSLKGTLFDLPNVLEGEAFSNVPERIRGRIDRVGGDFFESVPPADLYLLKWILHDWDNEQCVTILRNCRRSITPGGRIAIIELVLGEMGEGGLAPLMDMNMLVMLPGRERSLAEYSDLLARAGFGEVVLTRTQSPMAVITAVPSSQSISERSVSYPAAVK